MAETVPLAAEQIGIGDHLLHGGFVTEIIPMGGPARLRFKTTMGMTGVFRSDSMVWLDVEGGAASMTERMKAGTE